MNESECLRLCILALQVPRERIAEVKAYYTELVRVGNRVPDQPGRLVYDEYESGVRGSVGQLMDRVTQAKRPLTKSLALRLRWMIANQLLTQDQRAVVDAIRTKSADEAQRHAAQALVDWSKSHSYVEPKDVDRSRISAEEFEDVVARGLYEMAEPFKKLDNVVGGADVVFSAPSGDVRVLHRLVLPEYWYEYRVSDEAANDVAATEAMVEMGAQRDRFEAVHGKLSADDAVFVKRAAFAIYNPRWKIRPHVVRSIDVAMIVSACAKIS